MVACSLGNPMRRGSAAQLSVRFDPSGLELDERQLTFDIFANTTSKLVGLREPRVKLDVHVVKRAELSLQGWARPEQSFYSGEVRLDNAMMQMEDVGSQLMHTYQVSIRSVNKIAHLKYQIFSYLDLLRSIMKDLGKLLKSN